MNFDNNKTIIFSSLVIKGTYCFKVINYEFILLQNFYEVGTLHTKLKPD